ncbi:MAG: hypothetical protein R3C42_01590 [Parvularculaceae bacterium]
MIRQAVFAILAMAIGFVATPAGARVKIDITQANIEPMPIAVPDFIGAQSDLTGLGRDITGVVMADLDRSGLFSVIDQRAYVEKLSSVDVRPRFADWRIINAQVLVSGEVRPTPDGRIEVATRVWDVYSNEQLGAVSFKTPSDNWRRAAHKVADFVYKSLTGEDGYFDTRIVFVHETGPKEKRNKRLMIMDQDGQPGAADRWRQLPGPDPALLADAAANHLYGPFRQQAGQVYLFNIETGEQEQLGLSRHDLRAAFHAGRHARSDVDGKGRKFRCFPDGACDQAADAPY